MINVVIDTNVIISSVLSPAGNPAKVIDKILKNDDFEFYYSVEIHNEYRKVLSRPRLNIFKEAQTAILEGIKQTGMLISPKKSRVPLPDESDRVFYDTAKEAGAFLVTGNKKHFPNEDFILTPTEFLQIIENGEK
ncbi:MAG: putative toxin-antitoxin system toxin component, PIN family [Oscillospiraceae bacterium]|nr:putative toxin-antitoxin system toxin component, PIN family [Oscillospiraceae bacterium]